MWLAKDKITDKTLKYAFSSKEKKLLSHVVFFLFMRWDFGYCGHYWLIVAAPDGR
jgi:hypothetical protein